MPQMRTASRPVLASHSGGGFFVRRVALPGIVVARCTIKPLARRARTRLCNKENVPPVGAVKTAPKSRSPLPDWYPRTPLRDITSIVKALERRSRLEDAAAQQQIQWIEDSSQSADSTTPVQAEQNDPQSTLQPLEALGAVASGPGSTSVGANPPASVAEGELKESSCPTNCNLQALERRSRLEDAAAQQQIQWIEDSSQSADSTTPVLSEQNDPQSTLQPLEALGAVASGLGSTSVGANPPASVAEGELKESSSPSDCSLQTVPSKPNDSAHADLMEKKLSRSIEQIEKMVNQRLKETPKAAQPSKVSVQRRTLMTMR